MQRIRRSGALLATILATAVAVAPARRAMHTRALRVSGGANATSLAPEAKAGLLDGGEGGSLATRLFGAIRKTVRMTLRLLGFGKDGGDEDTAPATKKKAAAKKKRRSPARASPAQRQAQRISRELTDFVENPPDGCKVSVGKNLNVWIVTMTGAEGTIFAGEKYKLRVSFPADYPTSPPSCYFLEPTPRHPHVYTNGDICLNLLGNGWRPTITVAQLSLSILSMLSSAKTKGIPQDNAVHAASAPGKPQEGWMYHDDSC